MGRPSFLSLASTAAVVAVGAGASPWDPSNRQRASELVAKLNNTMKLNLLHGTGMRFFADGYIGQTTAIPGLVPILGFEDGPQGVADGAPSATAYPAGLTVSQTWNLSLAYAYGAAQGNEQYNKGSAMLLGPGTNLARVPVGGRNFEYLGEDPVLSSAMIAAIVKGIQSEKVLACGKHLIFNNQEHDRGDVSANVPLRAAMELYAKPFWAAVEAGVGSLMASYNRINNTYSSENPTSIGWFKDYAGFEGNIVSDWGAVHSVQAAPAGTDIEMADGNFFGATLLEALANGTLSQERLDDMAIRVLTPLYATGWMDSMPTGNLSANTVTPQHLAVARQVATESAALLKNDNNTLPLVPGTVKSIAILGLAQGLYYGGGSGSVVPSFHTAYYEALFPLYNNGMQPASRNASTACTITPDTQAVPANNATGICLDALPGPQACAELCAGAAGCNAFIYRPADRCITHWPWPDLSLGSCSLYADFEAGPAPPALGPSSGTCAPMGLVPTPNAPLVNISVYLGADLSTAKLLASQADVALVFVGTTSAEGDDRPTLALDPWMDAVVETAAAVNNRTVVVVNGPGAVLMPWAADVQAIVYNGMPGIEAASAFGDILTGKVSPSGKLPLSFPVSDDSTWLGTNAAQYPGTVRSNAWPEADYTEELNIGYRWYDLPTSEAPLWPFGHGLSYASFVYSGLQVKGGINGDGTGEVLVLLSVTNAGRMAAQEVVQLYVAHPQAANEPPKSMVGFQKVIVPAGKSVVVELSIQAKDIAIYDVTKPFSEAWTVVGGTYGVLVGASSADIRLQGQFDVQATFNGVQVVKR